jgi:hypothetical protein
MQLDVQINYNINIKKYDKTCWNPCTTIIRFHKICTLIYHPVETIFPLTGSRIGAGEDVECRISSLYSSIFQPFVRFPMPIFSASL